MTIGETSENVLSRQREVCSRTPGSEALVEGNRRLTYALLGKQTDRLARVLRDDGVAAGERVALILGNSVAFVLAYLATLKAGAVVVPINPATPLLSLAATLQDCTPTAAFVERRHQPFLGAIGSQVHTLRWAYVAEADGAPRREGALQIVGMEAALRRPVGKEPIALPEEKALAAVIYTSGTTGTPKGVMLSHRNLAANVASAQALLGLSQDARIGIVTPFFHIHGLRELDPSLCAGATVVLAHHPTYPARMLQQLHAARVTGFSVVPSMVALMLDRYRPQLAACGSHLSYMTVGTAHTSSSLLIGLRATLPTTRLIVTYGLTEAIRVCWREVMQPESDPSAGAAGWPWPAVEVQLVDAKHGTGQVTVRSAMVMQGYWNRPEATREVLGADGFLLTPDLGRLEANGMLYLLGRIDEVISCGGEKVSPDEVESVLSRHPAVAAVAVVSAPDPAGVLGEVVRAIVVPKPGPKVTAQELMRYAAGALEPYKVPRLIEFVEELPSTVLGKPWRALLREAESAKQ